MGASMRKALRFIAVLGVTSAVSGCGVLPGGAQECAEVVVSARPPEGGACQDFGNACQVPDDYVFCCNVPNGFCSARQECVDDPRDTCDPSTGGTGCQGICRGL